MENITAWVKKVWKDRKTEYPTRRTLTKTNGSQEIVTVARNEGNVSQEGDAFSAANMNDLEERIDAGFAEVTSNLTDLNKVIDLSNVVGQNGITIQNRFGYKIGRLVYVSFAVTASSAIAKNKPILSGVPVISAINYTGSCNIVGLGSGYAYNGYIYSNGVFTASALTAEQMNISCIYVID